MNQRNPTTAAEAAAPEARRPVFWITEHHRVYPLAARFRHGRFRHDGTPVTRDAGKVQA